MLTILGFAALLTFGILLIIFGALRGTQSHAEEWQAKSEQLLQSQGNATFVSYQGDMDDMPDDARDIIEQMLGGVITQASTSSSAMQSASLSDRLQQLEEAYQKNLISKAEYDKVRQAILERMDD